MNKALEKEITKIADKAVLEIIDEIECRKGIGDEWDIIDGGIKKEIRETLTLIVSRACGYAYELNV